MGIVVFDYTGSNKTRMLGCDYITVSMNLISHNSIAPLLSVVVLKK